MLNKGAERAAAVEQCCVLDPGRHDHHLARHGSYCQEHQQNVIF
jgi:hypothetical protein